MKLKTIALILLLGVAAGCKSKASDASKLFVYTTLDENIAQQLLLAFEKESGLDVEFVRLSTGEAVARIEAEKSNPNASLYLGGVSFGHQELKEKGLSLPYDSVAARDIQKQFKDPENYWSGIYMGALVFASNGELLKKNNLKAPESWEDLTKPEFKNRVQLPNPGTSGTSYNMMTTLITRDGEDQAFDYLKRLHKNVSQYTKSGSAPAKNVAIGEAFVAVGFIHDILRLIYESKAPLLVTYPKDGTGYEIAASSILKGAKNVEGAQKLYDWMYTKPAATILAEHYFLPLKREGVEVKLEANLPADLKLIDTEMNWAAKNKQRLIEKWNEKIKG